MATATRTRLEQAPTKAPHGSIWTLERGDQDHTDGDDEPCVRLVGLFSDRATIARIMVRNRIVGADSIRDVVRRTHWYQGAFNAMLFEGWAETPNKRGDSEMIRLGLSDVDAGW